MPFQRRRSPECAISGILPIDGIFLQSGGGYRVAPGAWIVSRQEAML
jgi:hypothetical protein